MSDSSDISKVLERAKSVCSRLAGPKLGRELQLYDEMRAILPQLIAEVERMQTKAPPRIEKPTEPGLYWFREANGWTVADVDYDINDGPLVVYWIGSDCSEDLPSGEWRGPLRKPCAVSQIKAPEWRPEVGL